MTAPATPPDWDAIARYLAGESSAEEAAAVRGWLEANPMDRELVERLNASVVMEAEAADVNVEAALARVHQRMNERSEPERPRLEVLRGNPAPRSKDAKHRGWYFVGLAAAAAVVIAVVMKRPHPDVSAPPTVQTYATGIGRTHQVILSDGSRITLGPQSRLTVPSTFANARVVELTGDAYFDVRHDASRPFTVHTASAVIEDIGTTFTVESDAGATTSVSVVTGSVRLRAGDSASGAGVVLAAGDRGSLDASGTAHVERNAVTDADTAWVSGRLAFRDATLGRVAAEIERWYGVKVRVADSSILSQHVTTSFEGENADRALQILGLTIGAKIERRGDSAIVSPNHGPAASR